MRASYIKLSIILITMTVALTARADEWVEQIKTGLISELSSSHEVEIGGFDYFDVEECFTLGTFCFGNNPSSPYGRPSFIDKNTGLPSPSFKLNPSSAVVILMRTPPEIRYFGLTQYLVNRGGSTKPIFASLSDTINNVGIKTIEASQSGLNPYNEHAAIVWTADMNTLRSVSSTLESLGISSEKINFLPLPINLPLFMGEEAMSDEFGLLLRAALPTVQAEYADYMNEAPIAFVKVDPYFPPNLDPAPTVGFKSEESGVSESPADKDALDALVGDIYKRYRFKFSFSESEVKYGELTGFDCITGEANCNGDNHDALYSVDSGIVRVNSLSDVVVVVGVNHQKTGKALYINHSVYDPLKLAGVSSVNDPELTAGSAYYHAGIKSLSDPRIALYKNLYVQFFAYDCGGLNFCHEIPAPTVDDPVGLEPGSNFVVAGRSYVDPLTGVRPSLNEIVKHRTFVGRSRSARK